MARSQEHGLAHARLSPTNSPEEGEATCTATWLGRQQCSSPLLPELGFGAAGPTSSVFLALGSGQAPSFTLAGLAEQPGPSLCTWWKPPPPPPPRGSPVHFCLFRSQEADLCSCPWGAQSFPLHKAEREPWPHLPLEGKEESLDLALNLPWDA